MISQSNVYRKRCSNITPNVLSLGLVADDSRPKPNKNTLIIKFKPKMDKNKTIPTLSQATVSGSLSFKEKMKQDIIPKVWQMAEKEKDHLNWLIDNNAPKDMIETSRRCLNNFRQRHKEYIEYADGL